MDPVPGPSNQARRASTTPAAAAAATAAAPSSCPIKPNLLLALRRPSNQAAAPPSSRPSEPALIGRANGSAGCVGCRGAPRLVSGGSGALPVARSHAGADAMRANRRLRTSRMPPLLRLAGLIALALCLAGPLVHAKTHHSKRHSLPLAEPVASNESTGDESGAAGATGGRESSNWWNIWWQQYIHEAMAPTVRPIVGVTFRGQTIGERSASPDGLDSNALAASELTSSANSAPDSVSGGIPQQPQQQLQQSRMGADDEQPAWRAAKTADSRAPKPQSATMRDLRNNRLTATNSLGIQLRANVAPSTGKSASPMNPPMTGRPDDGRAFEQQHQQHQYHQQQQLADYDMDPELEAALANEAAAAGMGLSPFGSGPAASREGGGGGQTSSGQPARTSSDSASMMLDTEAPTIESGRLMPADRQRDRAEGARKGGQFGAGSQASTTPRGQPPPLAPLPGSTPTPVKGVGGSQTTSTTARPTLASVDLEETPIVLDAERVRGTAQSSTPSAARPDSSTESRPKTTTITSSTIGSSSTPSFSTPQSPSQSSTTTTTTIPSSTTTTETPSTTTTTTTTVESTSTGSSSTATGSTSTPTTGPTTTPKVQGMSGMGAVETTTANVGTEGAATANATSTEDAEEESSEGEEEGEAEEEAGGAEGASMNNASAEEDTDEGAETETESPEKQVPSMTNASTTPKPMLAPVTEVTSSVAPSTVASTTAGQSLSMMAEMDLERRPKPASTSPPTPSAPPTTTTTSTSTTAPTSPTSELTTTTSQPETSSMQMQVLTQTQMQAQSSPAPPPSTNLVMVALDQTRGTLDSQTGITIPMDALMRMVMGVTESGKTGSEEPTTSTTMTPTMSTTTTTTVAPASSAGTEAPTTTTTPAPTTTTMAATPSTTTTAPSAPSSAAPEGTSPATGGLDASREVEGPPGSAVGKQRLQPPPVTTPDPGATTTTTTPKPSERAPVMMMSIVEPASMAGGEEAGTDGEQKMQMLNLDLMPLQRIMSGASSMAGPSTTDQKSAGLMSPMLEQQVTSNEIRTGPPKSTSSMMSLMEGATMREQPMQSLDVEPGMRLRPMSQQQLQMMTSGKTNLGGRPSSQVLANNQANTVYMIMMNNMMPTEAHSKKPQPSGGFASMMSQQPPPPPPSPGMAMQMQRQQLANKGLLTSNERPLPGPATSAITMPPSGQTTSKTAPIGSKAGAQMSKAQQADKAKANQASDEAERQSIDSLKPTLPLTTTTIMSPSMGTSKTAPASTARPSSSQTSTTTPAASTKTAATSTTRLAEKSTTTTPKPAEPSRTQSTPKASTNPTTTTLTPAKPKQSSDQTSPSATTPSAPATKMAAKQLSGPRQGDSAQAKEATSGPGAPTTTTAAPRKASAAPQTTKTAQSAAPTKGSSSKKGSSKGPVTFIPAKLRSDFNRTQPRAGGAGGQTKTAKLVQEDSPGMMQNMAIRQFGGANRMSALAQQPVPFGRPAAMMMSPKGPVQAAAAPSAGSASQMPGQSPGAASKFEPPPTFEYGPSIAVRRPDEPLANGQMPNCTLTGKNFCVLTKDYPMNEVRQAVERSFRSVRIMYEELQTVSDQELHKDDFNATNNQAASGKFACQTQVEMMRPGWAKDEITKEWMLVVNTDVFPQRVRTESCAQPNTPCEFIAPFYDSTCQQRYSLHRMIAIDPHDPSRSPQVAVFRFPAGCVCRVHPIRKTSTMSMANSSTNNQGSGVATSATSSSASQADSTTLAPASAQTTPKVGSANLRRR